VVVGVEPHPLAQHAVVDGRGHGFGHGHGVRPKPSDASRAIVPSPTGGTGAVDEWGLPKTPAGEAAPAPVEMGSGGVPAITLNLRRVSLLDAVIEEPGSDLALRILELPDAARAARLRSYAYGTGHHANVFYGTERTELLASSATPSARWMYLELLRLLMAVIPFDFPGAGRAPGGRDLPLPAAGCPRG
jgi:hypothetical protein